MARTRLYPPSVDPGFPTLPPTPEGWSHATFADVLEVVERPTTLSPEATYKLLTAKRSRGGIALRGELLGREILTKTQFETKAGDFLISRRQIIHGACGVVPDELAGAIVSNEYSTLRPRPNLLLGFLRQYSHTPYFQRTCFHSSHGVDVEKMIFKIDEWLAREVNVPPLGEQRKISAILSSVDDTIQATREVIDQVGVVRQATIAELLTHGPSGRRTKFKHTEIGEVPEHWDVAPLGSLCTEKGRYGANVPKAAFDPLTPRYVRITDIDSDGELSTEDRAGISEADAAPYLLSEGDIVFARSGATVGKHYVYKTSDGRCAHAGYLIRFRPDSSRLRVGFLGAVAQSDRYWQWVREAQRTQAQPNINATEYGALLVPVPPIEEQDEIVAAASAIHGRCQAEHRVLASMNVLKSALMSVLLTGEVRVKPDEESA